MKTPLIILSLFIFTSNAHAGVSVACLSTMQEAVKAWEIAYNGAHKHCKTYLDMNAAQKAADDAKNIAMAHWGYCAGVKQTLLDTKARSAAACSSEQCKGQPGVAEACAQGSNGLSEFLKAARALR